MAERVAKYCRDAAITVGLFGGAESLAASRAFVGCYRGDCQANIRCFQAREAKDLVVVKPDGCVDGKDSAFVVSKVSG